jgi:glutamate synthase (NADPH/NADH) small chain
MSEHKTQDMLDAEAKKELEIIRAKEKAGGLLPKDRLAIPAQQMPARDPKERARLMDEVALGYTEAQAVVEAARCLKCKNKPCVAGCPVAVPIPEFLEEIERGDFKKAASIIKTTNLLPSICGRVCPQETQCQGVCTLGKALKDAEKAVSIGRLERFAADWEREHNMTVIPAVSKETGKKLAVIGSGPAGLTVAADARRAGHSVTIFEALHKPGGVMVYGIPEFRLPKAIVADEVDMLKKMGVEFRANFLVGRTQTLPRLVSEEGFDAAFIGTGAGLPKFLGIEGEQLIGVFSANEYLTRANLMKAYDVARSDTPLFAANNVVVVGGGNVAMDAARMALRLGSANVTVVYRRTRVEMPARREEVDHAEEEGVAFRFLENPVKVLGGETGAVRGITALSYQLGESDESGRRRPVEIKGSEHDIACDAVIVALGNDSNPLLVQTTPGLDADKWGHITVDQAQKTSIPACWAGGDIVLGAATVILAMGDGRRAAAAINEYLGGG